MAATSLFRSGSDFTGTATGADPRALFLKMFANEVLLAFTRRTITDGKTQEKTVTAGKSWSFPLMGAIDSGYHTPGQNILEDGSHLQSPKTGEKVITADGWLISSSFIPSIDDLMNHWDTRGPISREMGWELARQYDLKNLAVIANAANTAPVLTGDNSDWGSTHTKLATVGTFHTDASVALDNIELLAASMDDADVPEEGRHLAIDPSLYHKLAGYSEVVSSDFNANTGGDVGKGQIMMIQGIHIWKTNMLKDLRARGNFTAGDLHAQQFGTDYVVDTTNVRGLAWQQDRTVGVVKLGTIGAKMQEKLEYLGDLIVAGFSTGHGVLHESAAYMIKSA